MRSLILALFALVFLTAAADAGQPGASFSQRTVTRTRGFVPAQQFAPAGYVQRTPVLLAAAAPVYVPRAPVLLAPAPVYAPSLQLAPANPCLTPAGQLRALRHLGY